MSDFSPMKQLSPEAFVHALDVAILQVGFAGHLQSIADPPGRRSPSWLTELSSWFNGLDEGERRHAENLAWRSAVYALQRFLAVLDGVIAVEGPGPKGELRLMYDREGASARLNDPTVASLEELLREEMRERG